MKFLIALVALLSFSLRAEYEFDGETLEKLVHCMLKIQQNYPEIIFDNPDFLRQKCERLIKATDEVEKFSKKYSYLNQQYLQEITISPNWGKENYLIQDIVLKEVPFEMQALLSTLNNFPSEKLYLIYSKKGNLIDFRGYVEGEIMKIQGKNVFTIKSISGSFFPFEYRLILDGLTQRYSLLGSDILTSERSWMKHLSWDKEEKSATSLHPDLIEEFNQCQNKMGLKLKTENINLKLGTFIPYTGSNVTLTRKDIIHLKEGLINKSAISELVINLYQDDTFRNQKLAKMLIAHYQLNHDAIKEIIKLNSYNSDDFIKFSKFEEIFKIIDLEAMPFLKKYPRMAYYVLGKVSDYPSTELYLLALREIKSKILGKSSFIYFPDYFLEWSKISIKSEEFELLLDWAQVIESFDLAELYSRSISIISRDETRQLLIDKLKDLPHFAAIVKESYQLDFPKSENRLNGTFGTYLNIFLQSNNAQLIVDNLNYHAQRIEKTIDSKNPHSFLSVGAEVDSYDIIYNMLPENYKKKVKLPPTDYFNQAIQSQINSIAAITDNVEKDEFVKKSIAAYERMQMEWNVFRVGTINKAKEKPSMTLPTNEEYKKILIDGINNCRNNFKKI